MFERPLLNELKQRMGEPRRFIQVLMGPRQVGKTTLATQLLEQLSAPSVYESADAIPAADAVWVEQIWEAARLRMDVGELHEMVLVFDEIQKVANWSEIVKKLWDEDTRNRRNIKLVLLGSSRLLIQQGLTESLAGRFESSYVGHWTFSEMRDAFGWNASEYVWFGGYPGAATLIHDEHRWKTYVLNSLVEASISRDILMLTRIDKPALMKRLFELGCLYSGQVLSYTKMQGQLQDAGNTTTLSHYLSLLDTAGLLSGLEKFAADVVRKRASSPKFQVYNNALLTAQQTETFETGSIHPALWGRMVESAVGAHLLNAMTSSGFKIFYWREGNKEVDFVLEWRGKVIGLEVKTGVEKNTEGMKAFKERFNPYKILLVGKQGIPWEDFLKTDPKELFR